MAQPIPLTRALLQKWPLPRSGQAADKEVRGRVLVVGGARELPGAVLLPALAALRVGAGKLRIATPQSLALAVGIAVPEGRVYGLPETPEGNLAAAAAPRLADLANAVDAVVIGAGTLEDSELVTLLEALLPRIKEALVVLDAAALDCLAKNSQLLHSLNGRAILTPHAGEMAHLLGLEKEAMQDDPQDLACRAAAQFRAVVVLKGVQTYIAVPDGPVYFNNAHGTVGLATSGSGDTLAGLMGGLAARGANPEQAAAWAVYLHARAGERLAARLGRLGFLAREIPDEVPPLLAEFDPPIG